jgi:hypothetical protein
MSVDGITALLSMGDEKYATVERLRDLFCQPGMESSWRSGRSDERRVTRYAGAASYAMTYPATFGFDDGYDMMGHLPDNWRCVSEAGDWPYLMFWADRRQLAMLSYCEGDFAIVVADDDEAFVALVRQVIADNPAP